MAGLLPVFPKVPVGNEGGRAAMLRRKNELPGPGPLSEKP